MKTPISILCISDLHFNNKESKPIRQLGKDLLVYTNNEENVSRLRWIPDYVVIAGDIINQGNKDYSEPRTHIMELLKEFKLPSNRVIMVPGNHDKDTTNYDLTAYKDECDLFDSYQKMKQSDSIQKFRDHFVPKFNDYLAFAQNFLSPTAASTCDDYLYQNPNILIPEGVEDHRAKMLSGIRYFEEDSLCFFLVNTEWLYIPPKKLMKEKLKLGTLSISNDYYDEIKEYLMVKENCKLCVPLINDAFNWIKNVHPECTVVTVMHRDFKDLTWCENNHTDLSQKDPVRQIENVSDVILTGHEHSVSIESPTFVKNNVQHYQIGSTGRDSLGKAEPVRTACVININPAKECVEMLKAHYDYIKNQWSFEESEDKFPLRHKYFQNEKEVLLKDETIIIKAKSTDEKTINAEIRAHFNFSGSDVVLCPIRYKADIKEELEKLYQNKRKETTALLFIVVYRIITDNKADNYIESDGVKQFKNEHLIDSLCNKLIINSKIKVVVPNLVFS